MFFDTLKKKLKTPTTSYKIYEIFRWYIRTLPLLMYNQYFTKQLFLTLCLHFLIVESQNLKHNNMTLLFRHQKAVFLTLLSCCRNVIILWKLNWLTRRKKSFNLRLNYFLIVVLLLYYFNNEFTYRICLQVCNNG